MYQETNTFSDLPTPHSVRDLISSIVSVILVDSLVEALVARIALVVTLEGDVISYITIPPIELITSPVASPSAPIHHLVAAVEAVILAKAPVMSLIAGIPLVMSYETRIIPAIAIAGEKLIVLLG